MPPPSPLPLALVSFALASLLLLLSTPPTLGSPTAAPQGAKTMTSIVSGVFTASSPGTVFLSTSTLTAGLVETGTGTPTGETLSKTDSTLDARAAGTLASVVLGVLVGSFVWFLFGSQRPKNRHIYACREWFVKKERRPPRIGHGFFAWLFPPSRAADGTCSHPVPLIPPYPPAHPSSPSRHHFPTDEELFLRFLWLVLKILLIWLVAGFGAAIPIYFVGRLPKLSQSDPPSPSSPGALSGGWNSLDDFSVLRLLAAVEAERAASSAAVLPTGLVHRLTVFVVLTLVLPTLPVLLLLKLELNALDRFRHLFRHVRCGRLEIGWFSLGLAKKVARARGGGGREAVERAKGKATFKALVGMGEADLRALFVRTGLSAGEDEREADANVDVDALEDGRRAERTDVEGGAARPADDDEQAAGGDERRGRRRGPDRQIDVQGVYAVCDTTELSTLLRKRNKALERLELTEARYITSFEPVAPEGEEGAEEETPSAAAVSRQVPPDAEPESSSARPSVRPSSESKRIRRKGKGGGKRRMRTFSDPHLLGSYVAPLGSYLMRRRYVSRADETTEGKRSSLADNLTRRFVGSKFVEVGLSNKRERASGYGFSRFALGSQVRVGEGGHMEPATPIEMQFSSQSAPGVTTATDPFSSPATVYLDSRLRTSPEHGARGPYLSSDIPTTSSAYAESRDHPQGRWSPEGGGGRGSTGSPAATTTTDVRTLRAHDQANFLDMSNSHHSRRTTRAEDEPARASRETTAPRRSSALLSPPPTMPIDVEDEPLSAEEGGVLGGGGGGGADLPWLASDSRMVTSPEAEYPRPMQCVSSPDGLLADPRPRDSPPTQFDTTAGAWSSITSLFSRSRSRSRRQHDSSGDASFPHRATTTTTRAGRRGAATGAGAHATEKSADTASTGQYQYPPPFHARAQGYQPFLRPAPGVTSDVLAALYRDIRRGRSELRALNEEVERMQTQMYAAMAEGTGVKGFMLVGRGVHHIPGVRMIPGNTKRDVKWGNLADDGHVGKGAFWIVTMVTGSVLAGAFVPIATLTDAEAPGETAVFGLFKPVLRTSAVPNGLAHLTCPAILVIFLFFAAVLALRAMARFASPVSHTESRLVAFQAVFVLSTGIAFAWFTLAASIAYAAEAWQLSSSVGRQVANGSINVAGFFLSIGILVALVAPALLALQPVRKAWAVRELKRSITPRQRFRALFPPALSATVGLACCMLVLPYAAAYSMLFPLVTIPALALVAALVAVFRYLVGYVAISFAETGGAYVVFVLRWFGLLLIPQPLLLGGVLASRGEMHLASACFAVSAFLFLLVAAHGFWHSRSHGRWPLNPSTALALQNFESLAKGREPPPMDAQALLSASRTATPLQVAADTRRSVNSLLDIVNAVIGGDENFRARRALPLESEAFDDIASTERAIFAQYGAPPLLPHLDFSHDAETEWEAAERTMYPPELLAPPPLVWLVRDKAQIALEEQRDMRQYWQLPATLDAIVVRDPHERLAFYEFGTV